MPKQYLRRDRFDGGLNKQSDPADIADNQLAESKNVIVSNVGRLVLAPDVSESETSYTPITGAINANCDGDGAYSFAADYLISGSPTSATDEVVACISDGTNINLYSYKDATQSTLAFTGRPHYLYNGGILRIVDKRFSATSKIYHYINKTRFGGAYSLEGWYYNNKDLAAPNFETFDEETTSADGALTDVTPPSDDAKVVIALVKTTGGDGTYWAKAWQCAVSYVYDDGQESLLDELATQVDLSATTKDYKITATIGNSMVGNPIPGLDRVAKLKVYLREYGTETYFLEAEFDFNEGGKTPSAASYNQWAYNLTYKYFYSLAETPTGTASDPEQIQSYLVETGIDQDETTIAAKYKTGVILQNRMFALHVQSNGVVYGDRILVSPPNAYDVLASSSYIDIIREDGDAYTASIGFGDRLLAFKKNRLIILNISSGDPASYFVEHSIEGMGVKGDSAVTLTDHGVVFVNENGAYIYTGGEPPKNLYTDDRVLDFWKTEFDGTPIVAYDRINKNIFMFPHTDSNANKFPHTDSDANKNYFFIFNMRTASWTWGALDIADSMAKKSNMFVHPDGTIFFFATVGTDINMYSVGTASAAHKFEIQFKMEAFGTDSVRKKISRFFITHKYGDGVSVQARALTRAGGLTAWTNMSAIEASNANVLTASKTDWFTDEYLLSGFTNVYKIQVRLYKTASTASSTFEINDIAYSYRVKSVR